MLRASVLEILAAKPQPLPLTARFRPFMGNLPRGKQFNVAITGEPGAAKSSFSFMLANELARTGKVLYAAAEENLDAGAIRERIIALRLSKKNIQFIHPETYSDIELELRNHKYDFCFIDSVNECYDSDGKALMAKDVIRIANKFPTVSFIFISQINAMGTRAAGGQKATHKADVKIFCRRNKKTEERTANLTGNRFNPKEYEFQIFPPKFPDNK